MSKADSVVSVLTIETLLKIRLEMLVRPHRIGFGESSNVHIEVMKGGEIILIIFSTGCMSEAFNVLEKNSSDAFLFGVRGVSV